MRKLIILFLLISGNCFAQFNLFGDGVNPVNQSNTWIGTQTFDSIYFNVLHSRTGSSNIFTTGTDGRRLNISNTSAEDSSRIQMTTLGNGGLVINHYGAVYVGNGGNADANDSIAFKVAYNTSYWKYGMAWTSNGLSGDPTTGVWVRMRNNSDSIEFGGLKDIRSGYYLFNGKVSVTNGTIEADTIEVNYLLPKGLGEQIGGEDDQFARIYSNNFYQGGVALADIYQPIGSYAITNNTNTFVNDQIFSGRVRTDTVLNVLGALTLNDTVTVTGRLNVTQETFFNTDIYSGEDRYIIARANSSGTQGVAINASEDNVLRIRNAGVSSYSTVMLNRLMIDDNANKSGGSATLSSGTIAVSNTSITANSVVILMPVGVTNAGELGVTLNAGVGFTIDSSNILDARVVKYVIQETF